MEEVSVVVTEAMLDEGAMGAGDRGKMFLFAAGVFYILT